MPTSCCVVSCTNRQFKGCKIKFFRLPSEVQRREAWLKALKSVRCVKRHGGKAKNIHQPGSPTGHERVCSDHFISGHYSINPSDPDYVPTLFKSQVDGQTKKARSRRSLKRPRVSSSPLSVYGPETAEEATPESQSSNGQMSLDYTDPDFVPSIFGNTNIKKQRPLRSTRKKNREETHTEQDLTFNGLTEESSDQLIPGQMSLDYNDPDFMPSKKTRIPKVKKQRPLRSNRRKNREETHTEQDLTFKNMTEPQNSDQLIPDGADIEVELADYDDLKLRYGQLYSDHNNLQMAFATLWTDHQSLKDTLHLSRINYSALKWDDRQLCFLTGLQSVVFDWLVTQISSKVSRIHLELTLQDHLLVVLMILKLGLCDTDMAYRFQISTRDITNIFQTWIPAMAYVLRPLISWPSAEEVFENRPHIFEKNFERCCCIMDCAEFVVGSKLTPNDWWNNKRVKYLIAVTPHGAVSFLSKGFHISMCDRKMARRSRFLHALEPLDEILANRAFPIRDIVDRIGATIHTPDLINGQRLKNSDFKRQFGHIWKHVKRVTGWWRRFSLLEKVIPALYDNLLDDVMTVCAAIINVSMSLDPEFTADTK